MNPYALKNFICSEMLNTVQTIHCFMKNILRREGLRKRKNLSAAEVAEKSNRIKHQLFSLPEFIDAQTILFYVSYGNEVSTHEMIQESTAQGKTTIVPKSNTRDNTLILSKLTAWDDLKPGAYGILEPASEKVVEVVADIIDVALVPGIVFDLQGNRIGHGKGYYDRLLQKMQGLSIGLAFEVQLIDVLPAEQHDVKVDKIITEGGVITCSP